MNFADEFLTEEVFKKACAEIEITKIVGSALEETLKNLFMEEFEIVLRRNDTFIKKSIEQIVLPALKEQAESEKKNKQVGYLSAENK